ncbi:FAST kinase domain-containing protein 5, mitochondrial-like [Ornithodoros turicata]|uniref:FAST kinase domain-containing protein 5, mitochondrial-like n=1 Tax=Ornithodoros turicata TaxID=34597 RepID=UPI0031392F67
MMELRRLQSLTSLFSRPGVSNVARKSQPKVFRELENEHFHQVMERLPAYRQTVVAKPTRENVGAMLSSENTWPFNEFRDVSLLTQGSFWDIENNAHTYLTHQISRKVHLAKRDQLKDCLLCLSLWPQTPGTTTTNFMQLWNALDRECTKRSLGWTPQTQLLFADCFFHLRLSRITAYNRTTLRNLAKSLHELPVHNVVQYLFLSNLQRWMVASADNILQDHLQTLIAQMSMEEIGIVCQGYFKCKKPIRNKALLKAVIEKTIGQVPNISSTAMCAIVKEARYSSSATQHVDSCKALLHACQPHIKHWDVPTIVQLYNLASSLRIFQPDFLLAARSHISSKLDTIRLKEISKLLYGLAIFGSEDEGFYEAVSQELQEPKRAQEIERYHHCLVSSVWYLALQGFYQSDLIRLALDESKINMDSHHGSIKFELAGLHHSVYIESPTYRGPLLSGDTLRCCLQAPHNEYIGTMQERLTKEIYDSLQRLCGQGARIVKILPHMHCPDIVFDIHVEKKSISEAKLQKLAYGIMKPENEACAVVVQGKSSFCHDSRRLNGIARAKVRQLRCLGFSVIQVPYFEANHFSRLLEEILGSSLRLQ